MVATEWPHLTKAPIYEAIIDLRVSLSKSVTAKALLDAQSRIKSHYPRAEERHAWQGKFEVLGGAVASVDLGVTGYVFRSEDNTQAVQFRLDGFPFSRLPPYQDWMAFRSEAYRVWELYRGAFSPSVTRVAVRYINRLDIPLPIDNLTDYFSSVPNQPGADNFKTASFLNRVELLDPTTQVRAMLTQAQQAPTNPNVASFLVDIDVFKESPFDSDVEAAWRAVDEFREIKNRLFFALVKEKALELYK